MYTIGCTDDEVCVRVMTKAWYNNIDHVRQNSHAANAKRFISVKLLRFRVKQFTLTTTGYIDFHDVVQIADDCRLRIIQPFNYRF